MTISPSGSPNSSCSDASACRAMAISVSAAPFCSSSGAVSYQRNGARVHAAALLPHHGIEAQPHLVSPLGGDQQHPALPLHDMAQERLPGAQRGRQIEARRTSCRRPIGPTSSPCPTAGIRSLISQLLSGRGSGSPCAYSGGRFGSLLRQLLVEIIIVEIIVELWIVGFILWRLTPAAGGPLGSRRCLGLPAAVASHSGSSVCAYLPALRAISPPQPVFAR